MRTITVTKRIGEWVDEVDWDYDFASHGWDNGGSVNPDCIKEGIKCLKMMGGGDGWKYSPSDFSSFPVACVGMYDGWPFWRPAPAIGYIGPLGVVEVAFFYNLRMSALTSN